MHALKHLGKWLAMLAIALFAVSPALAQTPGKKPNVIVIFGDDVGWGDLGSYGGGETRGAPTPNLDRIATEGVRFTTWYGQASCTAGRASLLTGAIPLRSALSQVIGPGDANHLHSQTPTMAEFYKKNGYKTYMSGKWHLGDKQDAFPTEHGFDIVKNFLAYYAGIYCYEDPVLHPWFPFEDKKFVDFYNKVVDDGEYEGVAGKPRVRVKEHFKCGDLAEFDNRQAASGVQFIKENAKSPQPFFMYVAYMKVHNPNFPSAEWQGKSRQGNFSDSMMELDANVGKIMQAVRDAGIEKDTIVVFSSDNGPWVDAWPDAGYGPFRGMKGTAFENGWRVPGLMWAPGRIPAGTVLHGMMSHMDVWPTTAAMAGLKPPPSNAEYVGNDGKPIFFDGMDNSAYVTGKAKESARQEWIYIDAVHLLGVRYKQWKFVFTGKDSWLGPNLALTGLPAVYNLQMDPGEQYDMVFNGAAPRAAGVLGTSPGRYAGADNGWTMVYPVTIVEQLTKSFEKYPPIPTTPGGPTIGSDLPEFVMPNMIKTQ